MIELLGIACVVWTVIELVRLSRETPSLVRTRGVPRAGGASRSARPHRTPLAAWDEEGRPIFVEDVAFRNVH